MKPTDANDTLVRRPPGALFLLAWVVLTAVPIGFLSYGILHPFVFPALGIAQGALLVRPLGRRALEWALITSIFGAFLGFAIIVLIAMANSGVPLFPEFASLTIIITLVGFALSAAQSTVLRRRDGAPLRWVVGSTVGWALGGAALDLCGAVTEAFSPPNLFQRLLATGLDSMAAARAIGWINGFVLGVPVSLVTGVVMTRLLRGSATASPAGGLPRTRADTTF